MKVRGLARKEERSHNQPAKGDVIPGQVHPEQSRRLTAAAECPQPQPEDMSSESRQCRVVRRHGVIGEVPTDDLRQPSSLLGDLPGCKRRSENPSLKRPGCPVAPE